MDISLMHNLISDAYFGIYKNYHITKKLNLNTVHSGFILSHIKSGLQYMYEVEILCNKFSCLSFSLKTKNKDYRNYLIHLNIWKA